MSRLDLNLFVVFEAIFDEGGVTRAGQRLNLTQPAISHALGRLRAIFDDPLFARQGNDMVPTPLARSLIEPVRRALRTFEAVVGDSGAFDPATAERRFVVGLRDVMEAEVLPPLVAHFAETAPRIDVSSVRIDRGDLERDLAGGVLDAAIDVLMPMSREVRSRLIAGDGLVVVARRGHPRVGPGLDLDTYLAEQHVLVSSRRRGLGLADLEIAKLGRHRHIRLRCQQSYAACRVVSGSDLVLTMPARYARLANLPFDNQILPAPFDGPSQNVFLYWHASTDRDPAGRWLRARLFEAFGQSESGEEGAADRGAAAAFD